MSRLFNVDLSNPDIPVFHSRRVKIAFGRAFLQRYFEYQQLVGEHNLDLDYDAVSDEAYFAFGSLLLTAYRDERNAKTIFAERKVDLKAMVSCLEVHVVHCETRQRVLFNEDGLTQSMTSARNIQYIADAAVSSIASAAGAAAQSSSTHARVSDVAASALSEGLARNNLILFRTFKTLLSMIIKELGELISPEKTGDLMEDFSKCVIYRVRFTRICSIVLGSLNSKFDFSGMKEQWGQIELKHAREDFDGIGLMTREYCANLGALTAKIARFDRTHRLKEVAESVTGASGWSYTTKPPYGESVWKEFDTESEGSQILDKVSAASLRTAKSGSVVVIIKVEALNLGEDDEPESVPASSSSV